MERTANKPEHKMYMYLVSERGFTSIQRNWVIHGRVKHGKRRNTRWE